MATNTLLFTRLASLAVLLTCGSVYGAALDREQVPRRHLDDDEVTALLTQDLPGFAGTFRDENGVKYVYLKDMSKQREAQARFDAEALPATYSFVELLDYRNRAIALINKAGLTFVDLDEKRNLIHVGVDPLLGRAGLTAAEADLIAAGLPADALAVEPREAVRAHGNLIDKVVPISAGTQLVINNSSLCTLGFNATLNGVRGFVTNSHCVGGFGITGASIRQGGTGAPVAGSATTNPALFTGGVCPSGSSCRYSDAAFVTITTSDPSSPNIMLTTGFGSTTIAPRPGDHAPFRGPESVIVGDWTNKTGRTSGWGAGFVTDTCVATAQSGTSNVMLCQTFANYTSQPGDSGSPVWRGPWSHLQNGMTLLGINWGGSGVSGVFSPLSGILASTDLVGLSPFYAP